MDVATISERTSASDVPVVDVYFFKTGAELADSFSASRSWPARVARLSVTHPTRCVRYGRSTARLVVRSLTRPAAPVVAVVTRARKVSLAWPRGATGLRDGQRWVSSAPRRP